MTAAEDRRGSTRAAGIVGMAILSSRILGLIREMVFAGLFGAGRNLDAFLMAFRLPNLLRDLFAEGALSTAFITTFSKKIAVDGDESAWRLANKVATLTAVFMSAVTLLGIVFAPQLVGAFNLGELVAGQDRADHFAHAHHVAIHVARVAGRVGDGHAQREDMSSARRRWRRVILISVQSLAASQLAGGSIRISVRVRWSDWRSGR